MTGEKALNNIAVEFDEMGMICSNIAYKDFWEKDLHFKEIFGCEYEIIMKDLKRLEQLEKELKKTKLNFRNSQTHSKNCYKKLKEKYARLERAYKSNEVMTRDLNELINKNIELKQENQGVADDNTRLWHGLECANNENAKLKQAVKTWNENGGKLLRENEKLKQALEKACERLDDDCPVSQELIDDLDCENCNNDCKECWVKFFLNQAFESVGDSDE